MAGETELEQERLKAQAALAKGQKVSEWFATRSKNILMICEFRECPDLRSGAGAISSEMARAVAAGLCYAMVFPFSYPAPEFLPTTLRAYLDQIYLSCANTYNTILRQTLEIVHEQICGAGDRKRGENVAGSLEQKLSEVVDRLKLYHLADEQEQLCPTIGHRLFYVEDRSDDNGVSRRESWEPLTIEGVDHVVERFSARELRIMGDRFQPIIGFWNDHELTRLPANRRDLADAPSRFDSSLFAERQNSQVTWAVYPSDVTCEEIVNEFLKIQQKTKRPP